MTGGGRTGLSGRPWAATATVVTLSRSAGNNYHVTHCSMMTTLTLRSCWSHERDLFLCLPPFSLSLLLLVSLVSSSMMAKIMRAESRCHCVVALHVLVFYDPPPPSLPSPLLSLLSLSPLSLLSLSPPLSPFSLSLRLLSGKPVLFWLVSGHEGWPRSTNKANKTAFINEACIIWHMLDIIVKTNFDALTASEVEGHTF